MEQSERPNILLITTDQQRFDTCGKHAPDFMRTPHLNQLAAEGITFSRAYADCPVCVPGRTAIMTGQSVFRHGMATNAPTCDYFGSENTLPTLLHEAGYQTLAVGKCHFHPQHIKHGFDETIVLDDYYREMRQSGSLLQPRRHGLGENELTAGMATVPEAQTLTSWITEKAVEWLTERRDPTRPWFLWVSYSKPHPPLDPPEPYYSMYRNCDMPEPLMDDWADNPDRPGFLKRSTYAHNVDRMPRIQLDEAKAAYYGLITQIDYNIGRIMAAVQDTGCFFNPRDNTMIAFASDHGERLGDHLLPAKNSLHEGSAHVPFILRLPRTWQERYIATECEQPVTLHDLLPTFVNAAEGAIPETAQVDGQDLVALLDGRLDSPRTHLLCGMGFNRKNPDGIGWVGVTDGRWKYAWYYDDGKEQLFDIETDPDENHDLASKPDFAEKKAALKAEVIRQLENYGGRFLKDGELYSRDTEFPSEEKLRAGGFPGFMRDKHKSDALH